jgi:hypothetical protein
MKRILPIYMLLVMTACESTLQNFDIHTPEPKLAAYSFAFADSTPRLFLSRNMNLSEDNELHVQKNAIVDLYEGNDLFGVLTLDTATDYYINANLHFRKDQYYRYVIKEDGYDDVEADFFIPDKPVVYSIDTQIVWSKPTDCYECSINAQLRIEIVFQDNTQTKDYYTAEVLNQYGYYANDPTDPRINDLIEYSMGRVYSSTNAPFIETIQSGNSYHNSSEPEANYGDRYFFSDEYLEEGKNTLVFNIDVYDLNNYINDTLPGHFTVCFSKIDENLFNYAKSRGKNYNADENPFVEPVSIYTNVSQGLGLVSGACRVTKSFDKTGINEIIGN